MDGSEDRVSRHAHTVSNAKARAMPYLRHDIRDMVLPVHGGSIRSKEVVLP
jgi:hypothetical protein